MKNKIYSLLFAGALLSEASYAQSPSLEWASSLGGSGNDVGLSIATDGSGNVFTAGRFNGTADFDPGPGVFNLSSNGNDDIYISKLDASGNFVWAVGIGSTSSDRGRSIAVDASGNVLVTGDFRNTVDFNPAAGTFNLTAPSGLADIFVLKLDGDGNFLWAKSFGDPGVNADVGYSIATDASDNVYTMGTYSGTADFDPGAGSFPLTSVTGGGFTDIFISKLDPSGNFVWAKSIGGTSSDRAFTLSIDPSNNVFVGGEFIGTVDFDPNASINNVTSVGAKDLFVLKLDANGNFVWVKTFGAGSSNRIWDVVNDANGNVLITGEFFSIIDLDPGPAFFNQNEAGSGDMFISKLDASGNFVWGAGIGGTQEDSGRSVAVDASGNSYFTGHFAATVDFDPGAGVFNLSSTPSNAYDIFISKHDPSGNLIWAGSVGGTSDFEIGNSIAVSSAMDIYITGEYYGTADFDPGSSLFNLSANGTAVESFVVKLGTASPILSITTQPSNVSACFGEIINYSVAGTGTSNITYQWQLRQPDFTFTDIVNGGAYSGASTATLTVNTGIGTVSLAYRCKVNGDFVSEEISNAASLLLLVAPTAPSTTGASGCSPSSLTLSASGGTNGEYRWYTTPTGGTPIAGETNSTYATPLLTSSVTYYVSRMLACESARTPVTATINATPAKPTITSSITPSGGNVSVCSSNTLTLAAPSGFNSYLWSNGQTTQQITVTSSGNYSVIVDSGNGCNSPSSDFITVTLIPAPCSNQSPVITTFQTTSPIAGNVSVDLISLISDADNNLDLASLKIVIQPISGAQASIINSQLIIDYAGLSFIGSDKLTIEVCDLLGSCSQQEITIEVVGDLIVYTGISPNGDTYNEKWIIENINALPDTKENKVSIYNRWGDLVFETTNYDNDTRVFKGINENGNEVTSGVYFYKIEFGSTRKSLTGYLAVKK